MDVDVNVLVVVACLDDERQNANLFVLVVVLILVNRLEKILLGSFKVQNTLLLNVDVSSLEQAMPFMLCGKVYQWICSPSSAYNRRAEI